MRNGGWGVRRKEEGSEISNGENWKEGDRKGWRGKEMEGYKGKR